MDGGDTESFRAQHGHSPNILRSNRQTVQDTTLPCVTAATRAVSLASTVPFSATGSTGSSPALFLLLLCRHKKRELKSTPPAFHRSYTQQRPVCLDDLPNQESPKPGPACIPCR